jgi:hypothetical protein
MTSEIQSQNQSDSKAQIQKYEETIRSVADELRALAETVDTDLGLQIQELAKTTTPDIKGIDTPNQGRVQFQRVSLKQNSSNSDKIPAETKAGQLYTSQSVHLGDSLDFIPVFTHNNRKRWGDDDKIECQSLDGITGNKYGNCKTCPYGQFVKDQRPQCSPGSTFYVVTEDLKNLYSIDFTKTSAKAGKNIRQLSLPPNMWSRVFTLASEKQQNSKNTYFTLKTTATARRTSEQVSKVCDLLFEYFNSNYKKALLLQQEYLKNRANGGAAGENAAGTPLDPAGEINFSDSM